MDLEDIMTGDSRLFCLTNTASCCRHTDTDEGVGRLGVWYLPDGSEAPSYGMKFSRDRGTSFVALARGAAMHDFRCTHWTVQV